MKGLLFVFILFVLAGCGESEFEKCQKAEKEKLRNNNIILESISKIEDLDKDRVMKNLECSVKAIRLFNRPDDCYTDYRGDICSAWLSEIGEYQDNLIEKNKIKDVYEIVSNYFSEQNKYYDDEALTEKLLEYNESFTEPEKDSELDEMVKYRYELFTGKLEIYRHHIDSYINKASEEICNIRGIYK